MQREALEQWLRSQLSNPPDWPEVPAELVAQVAESSLKQLQEGKISPPNTLQEYAEQLLAVLYYSQHASKRGPDSRAEWEPALVPAASPKVRARGMLFSTQQECGRGSLSGSYRIEHRPGATVAATLWQSHSSGPAEIILVPSVALFDASCSVVWDKKVENCRFVNVGQLDGLAPREDGSVVIYTHTAGLAAGTYEFSLIQRNSAGGERLDRFTISVVDPNLPPRKGALGLVRAARLGH